MHGKRHNRIQETKDYFLDFFSSFLEHGFNFIQESSVDGEDYVSEQITSELLKAAEQMVKSGTLVEIRHYLAA